MEISEGAKAILNDVKQAWAHGDPVCRPGAYDPELVAELRAAKLIESWSFANLIRPAGYRMDTHLGSGPQRFRRHIA